MNTSSVTQKAYETLLAYVKRNRYNSSFDTNGIRERLVEVGLKPSQVGGVVGRAVKQGIINRVGFTASTNPNHKGGTVGVYERTPNSYAL